MEVCGRGGKEWKVEEGEERNRKLRKGMKRMEG